MGPNTEEHSVGIHDIDMYFAYPATDVDLFLSVLRGRTFKWVDSLGYHGHRCVQPVIKSPQ